MKKIALLLLALPFVFSCNKDDDNNAGCAISMTSIAGTYKISSLKYKQTSASAEVDLLASFDACEKDDLMIFASSGTFTYQDAGTKCTPDGSYADTWSLSGNTMTVEGEPATIKSFDCKTLVVTQSSVLVPGDLATGIYVKQ